jgi:hypothetical protein
LGRLGGLLQVTNFEENRQLVAKVDVDINF